MNLREAAYVVAVDLTAVIFVPSNEVCQHVYDVAASADWLDLDVDVWSYFDVSARLLSVLAADLLEGQHEFIPTICRHFLLQNL